MVVNHKTCEGELLLIMFGLHNQLQKVLIINYIVLTIGLRLGLGLRVIRHNL